MFALSGCFLYTFVNSFLVLKPFLFRSDKYQQLSYAHVPQYKLMSVAGIKSTTQSQQIQKLIQDNLSSVFVGTDVSNSSELIKILRNNFSNVVTSSENDSAQIVFATNLAVLSSQELGVDIPSGLIVKVANPDVNIAICSPKEIVDKFTNSQAKMALRRIATAMRHSKENWIVICRVGGSVFSPLYQKFIEATNYATSQLETPSNFGLGELVFFNSKAKKERPIQVFYKGNIAVKLIEKFQINDSQPALFSSFLTSSQALSSSSNE